MRTIDLCAIGAAALPTQDLVSIVVRGRLRDDDLKRAERALTLVGAARESALRESPAGPQLMAAVELGRRAWMLPSPAGRRIRAPVDVATVVAPRAVDDTLWALSLDARLTLARLERVDADAGAVLRSALGAGVGRLITAVKRSRAAVPDGDNHEAARRLSEATALLGVKLVDHVILGDDGFCSLVRTGLLPATEPRYR